MYRTWTTPLSVILRRGDTGTARWALGSVLGVGDTDQRFSCQPDGVVSGTQPVCEPLPCSAPKVDSEYGVDVCIYSADERRCMVSCANGCSMVEILLDLNDERFLD